MALVLRKELGRRLKKNGLNPERNDIKQDLQKLQEVTVEGAGEKVIIRTEDRGTCSAVFKAVRIALPLTIQKPESLKM